MLRKSSRSVNLGLWYQRLLGLPYIVLHMTPFSGKYVLMKQWKLMLWQLYLNMDAAGTPKTSVTIHQITWRHIWWDRNICSKTSKKQSWKKLQVMICGHTNCNMADVTCYKAMLNIFSEILKKTKGKLNYCAIRQWQNTFVCEVDVSIATRHCLHKNIY
jgi:hypothetical protein